MECNIGDIVKIETPGLVCSSWEDMYIKLGATNWVLHRGGNSGHIRKGMKGKIINKLLRNEGKSVYLIEMKDSYQYVFMDGFILADGQIKSKEVKEYGIVKFMRTL